MKILRIDLGGWYVEVKDIVEITLRRAIYWNSLFEWFRHVRSDRRTSVRLDGHRPFMAVRLEDSWESVFEGNPESSGARNVA